MEGELYVAPAAGIGNGRTPARVPDNYAWMKMVAGRL